VRQRAAVASVTVLLLVLVLLPSAPAAGQSEEFPVIQVPPGFRIEKVVGGLTYATSLAWDDQNRLHVTEAGGAFVEQPPPARLLRVDNGRAVEVANLTNMGVGDSVVGLTFHDGAFFFTHRDGNDRTGAVSRLTPDGQRTQILSGFIDSQAEHQVNDLKVGPDGRMYLTSGQAANAGVLGIDNAPNIMRSPQVRPVPCRDLVLTGRNFETPDFRTEDQSDKVRTGAYSQFGTATTRGQVIPGEKKCGGAILAFDPAQAEATVEFVADGLRNVIGVAWSEAGEMYTTVNGYDIRGSRPVRDDFDGTYRVREGTWYGYPDYSAALEPLSAPKFDVNDAAQVPVFIGDQMQPKELDFVIDHEASGLEPPDKSLIAGLHEWNSSPSLLDVAPASWGDLAGQVFVTEWGDLAPPTNPLRDKPVGSRIARLDPQTRQVIPFLSNVRRGPASEQGAPGMGLERPFDVKFGPDGAMYIADYGAARINRARAAEGKFPYEFPPETGAIWRVTPSGTQPAVMRTAGAGRAETAALLSQQSFQPGVPAAFVATADEFADALAGGPAAVGTGGPVLLTQRDELPEATANELRRLQPSQIVLLGGQAAVSEAVRAQLQEFTSGDVTRVAGPTRFGTAAAVSALAFSGAPAGPPVAYIATGEQFPDALTGGVPAAMQAGPLLLTRRDELPEATVNELARLQPRRIVVLGGSAAVSAAVERQLAQFTVGGVTRQAGPSRFATAAAVATNRFPAAIGTVYVATGERFPDALAAVPAAAIDSAPLLLVEASEIPPETAEELRRLAPDRIVVLGGESAVSAEVEAELEEFLSSS
jgi:putative cell wall-binding protein/glucose/arabinose dehydrogenase